MNGNWHTADQSAPIEAARADAELQSNNDVADSGTMSQPAKVSEMLRAHVAQPATRHEARFHRQAASDHRRRMTHLHDHGPCAGSAKKRRISIAANLFGVDTSGILIGIARQVQMIRPHTHTPPCRIYFEPV